MAREVEDYVRFVKFTEGKLYINLETGYPKGIMKNLNSFFEENNFKIEVVGSDEKGQDTLTTQKQNLLKTQMEELSKNPVFREILNCFPDSVVANIEDL